MNPDVGKHIVEHNMLGISASLRVSDDGTFIIFKAGATTLFKIRKSDGQFQIAGGYDSGISL